MSNLICLGCGMPVNSCICNPPKSLIEIYDEALKRWVKKEVDAKSKIMTENSKKQAFVKKLATEVTGLAMHASDPDHALMVSEFIDKVWKAYDKVHSKDTKQQYNTYSDDSP